MSDEIEVEVTVPDAGGDAESQVDESTAVVAGEARAEAVHAVETADGAATEAEFALEVADTAMATGYSNSAELDVLLQAQTAQTNTLNIALERIQQLTAVVQALAEANLAAVDSNNDTTVPPKDEAPESRHWLDKKVF